MVAAPPARKGAKHRCQICRMGFESGNKLHVHVRSVHKHFGPQLPGPRWPPQPPANPIPPSMPSVGPPSAPAMPPPLPAPRMEPPPPAPPAASLLWWMLPPQPPPPVRPFRDEPPPPPKSLVWKRAGYHELPEAKKTKVNDEMPRRRLQEPNAELSDLAQRAISMAAATAAEATRQW